MDASEIRKIEQLHLLPPDSFYVTVNGRIVSWELLNENALFQVHFRLRGGKGGFGSLLRSFRIHRSTNQLMCRDLTGRRLADVKEEEKLRLWIEKASEREEEKRRKRQEKYERLKSGPPKHEFTDQTYIQTREKLLDETDEAFEAGIASLSSQKKVLSENNKETIILEYQDEETDAPGPSGLSLKRKAKTENTNAKKSKLEDLTSRNDIFSDTAAEEVDQAERNTLRNVKDTNGANECEVAPIAEEKSKTDEKKSEARVFAEIKLEGVESVEALECFGLDHLKNALETRGLKCGGSLKERATRLYSVKGLKPDEYPKSIRAVSQKKKRH